MLRSPQPEAALAGGPAAAAPSAVAEEKSLARIVINVPYNAYRPRAGPRNLQESKPRAPSHRPRRKLRPGGRLVDAADEALQPQRQSAPLLLREKAPELALVAVRLDGEPARMQACRGAAQFNLRPMPRERDAPAAPLVARFHAHLLLRDGNGLAMKAALEGDLQRPPEECHFRSRERPHQPESLGGEKAGDAAGQHARGAEERSRTAQAERAVRADVDAQRLGVHVAIDGSA